MLKAVIILSLKLPLELIPCPAFFKHCAVIYYVIYDGVAHYTFVVSLGNNKEALFVLRRKSRIFSPALGRINSTITVTMHQALPNKFNQPMTDDLSQEYLL